MTYVPVDPENRAPQGRPAHAIPDALLAQLRHSRDTGARCRIDLTDGDSAADIAELKRVLVRAGYRHFSEHTINKRFRTDYIEFWVGPKRPAGQKRNGDE